MPGPLPTLQLKKHEVERATAMKLPNNRNDRVMVGMGTVVAGLLFAVAFTTAFFDPQFTELCSTSKWFGNSASAAEEPSKPRMYHAQPANGPVLPAHKVSKIVKSDGPISIVRDPNGHDLVIKMVNLLPVAVSTKVDLKNLVAPSGKGKKIVLTGHPADKTAVPFQSEIVASGDLVIQLSPYSLTVIRLPLLN